MRNALLEFGGKRIVIIPMEESLTESLAELCPSVMWEAELVSNELG